jgi:hypothetical protein
VPLERLRGFPFSGLRFVGVRFPLEPDEPFLTWFAQDDLPGLVIELEMSSAVVTAFSLRRAGDDAATGGYPVPTWPDERPIKAITTRVLRRVRLGEIASTARLSADRFGDWVSFHEAMATLAAMSGAVAGSDRTLNRLRRRAADETLRRLTPSARPGRAGRPAIELAALAAAYVDLVKSRNRTPTATLAKQRGYSAAQVRSLLAQAEKRGLLAGRPKNGAGRTTGVAGGYLTKAAVELLEEH